MATKRKSSRGSKEGGSTLYGVLAGLLIGLVVAAIVAFYVTNAPMPFVDRTARDSTRPVTPAGPSQPMADPNLGLYGRDGPAGNSPTGPTATPPVPLPEVASPGKPQPQPQPQPKGPVDDLGALIATLPSGNPPAAAPAPAVAAIAKKPAPPQATSSGTYFLQVGAYRGEKEAEALRARILLLGLPVAVQRAQVNGGPINRVRVGPFAKLDDMNRARSRLGENKIESTVVRQQ